MKIRHLYMQNFRAIESQDFEFDPSVTVLAGRNGGGKSTVLEALAIMLSWIPAKISTISGKGKGIEVDDISHGKSFSRLSLDISSDNAPKSDMRLSLYKKRPDCRESGRSDMRCAKKFGRDMRLMMEADDSDKMVEIPVLAYYGANRDKFGYSSPSPDSDVLRTSIYKNAFKAASDFDSFARWAASVIPQRDGESARKISEESDKTGKKYDRIGQVEGALAKFSPDFSSFSSKGGRLFVNSKNVFADRLSDGEKAAIALISDIAMRMIVANPDKDNPLDTAAVILVDEIDLHMYPEWQAKMARRLPEIFPNAQFVLSSHSPAVMSSARSLYKIGSSEKPLAPVRFDRVESPYGREPSDILKDLLNSRRPREFAEKIKKMYDAIDSGDLRRAESVIAELNEKIPDDPEVMRGEYLVRAMLPRD